MIPYPYLFLFRRVSDIEEVNIYSLDKNFMYQVNFEFIVLKRRNVTSNMLDRIISLRKIYLWSRFKIHQDHTTLQCDDLFLFCISEHLICFRSLLYSDLTQLRSSAPKSGGGGAQTFFKRSEKQKKKKKEEKKGHSDV